MATMTYDPDSVADASTQRVFAIAKPPRELTREQFTRAWNALAYLFPGLHPDEAKTRRGGWPASLKPLATEAIRRADAGEIANDELYPSDARWCGLYDRMLTHTPEETERRRSFATERDIEVGDIVRFVNSFPDEVGNLLVITEWNGDRGFGQHLGTNMTIAPTTLLRVEGIEVVRKAHA